jgi:hypothetical protein
MQMNQAPMNLTTDVVFGSSSLRLRCACLANAIAAVGRMTIQRPSDPKSRKKRPTSLLFVMVSVHSSRNRHWSFVVGRWLTTKDHRPKTKDWFQATSKLILFQLQTSSVMPYGNWQFAKLLWIQNSV